MSVLIETTEGNLVVDLYHETFPLLCFNFLKLCEINYYFFTPFYDLTKDLLVKTGNPQYPEGDGGEAINNILDVSVFDENIRKERFLPVGKPDVNYNQNSLGVVSFIVEKRDSEQYIGSQFTISLTQNSSDLTQFSQIPFGKIVEGFIVLEKLNNAKIDDDDSKRLANDIRILHTYILNDPFPKIPGIISKKKPTDMPSESQLQHIRIPELNNDKISSDIRNKEKEEATLLALTLELIGDLPHYQIKPSPKTLFIAKLNPITTSDALSIIFGRFGEVVNSNVIKDYQTGKSLCYGFIEFDKKEEAERAYLTLSKGCFIDGREVLVDFSQSIKNS